MEKNLKNMRQEFKSKGIFYTPPELAEMMKKEFTNPDEITEIYDPTVGQGNLLAVFDENVAKYGEDIDEDGISRCKERFTNFTGEVGDTLKTPQFIDRKFKWIISNPPFSIAWEPPIKETDVRFKDAPTIPTKSNADWAFILHILYQLTDDGEAIIMHFPGTLYRTGREEELRKWVVEKNWIDKIISVEGNKFADTTIATVLICINKNKGDNTDITFINQKGEEKVIGIEKIREEKYRLSPELYIPEEIKIKKIDIKEIEKNIEKRMQILNSNYMIMKAQLQELKEIGVIDEI